VLLKMADLGLVQVRTLVDETDIGKIQVGQRATVTVDAYPNRPFEGTVLKIEPQAITEQNVTMFAVLVRIDNRAGLLRPGMNCEVEIHVGQREDVLAVPNAALRTQRDVGSAAQVLGLSPEEVQRELAAAARPGAGVPDTAAAGQAAMGGSAAGGATGSGGDSARAGTTRDGRTIARGGGSRGARAADASFGGRYVVFVQRPEGPKAVWIRTGLTDLDYSEVVDGLEANDSVLILPSAGLVQSQQESRERINRVTGGGLPGLQQQTTSPATRAPGGR
jgi:HlyD family secretion protein